MSRDLLLFFDLLNLVTTQKQIKYAFKCLQILKMPTNAQLGTWLVRVLMVAADIVTR